MKFGDTPVGESEGAILAHSVRLGKKIFKKGRVLSADDVAALNDAGIATIVAARLDADDVGEDEAAARIASGKADRGLGHASHGAALQQNLVCVLEGE